jgi:hypothetical protein
MKKTILTLAILAMAGVSQAGISHTVFVFDAADSSGTLLADGTYLLVADWDNDGWNPAYTAPPAPGSDNASSWLWDAADEILDIGQIADGFCQPFFNLPSADLPLGGGTAYNGSVYPNRPYYFLWFDLAWDNTLTVANAASKAPGANVDYGAVAVDVMGTDSGDYGPFFPTTGKAGQNGMVTMPEPATLALMAVGSGLMMALRRRSR